MEEERHAHRRSSRESGLGAGEEENREATGAARPARGRSEEEAANGGSTTLYVSNIPLRCSLGDVRRIFEEVGEVRDCRIVTNPVTRESRGFAFVSYRDPANTAAAIERLDGKAYCGDSTKPLRVERAKRNRPHQPTPGLYKGPPGASVKYDKSGRLRPGFLPYYAVAPGASREFYPPAAAAMGLPPFDYFYDGPPGGRGDRGRGGAWPDDRGFTRSGGGAAGAGGGYEYVRSGVGGAYVDRYGGGAADYVPRGAAAGYADNGAAAGGRGDYYGYGGAAAGAGRVGDANGRSSAYSSSRGGAGAAAGNSYYYDVGRGAGGATADALYDARGSAGYEGRGAATAVYYGEQRAADEAMARYAAYGGEFYYNAAAPSAYEGYTTRGAEGHREKIPRERSRSRDRGGRDRRRSTSGSRPRRSTRR